MTEQTVIRDNAAQPRHAGRSPLPNGGDIIFMFLMFLLLVLLPNFVFVDGSTGWHLVSGQYIIDNLRIPRYDLISYTFPSKDWLAYEWLFDFVAAGLVKLGGLNLLAVATTSAIGFLFVLLFGDARRTGCPFLLALVIVLIGALASSIHWLARPHLFTFFGVYIFSRSLEAFHGNNISGLRVIVILGLAMIVWANAHPAFLIGFTMVMIYLASEAVMAAVLPLGEDRGRAWTRAGTLLAALAIMSAASLINPSGSALYPYIAKLLRDNLVVGGSEEYMSPIFHGQVHAACLELLFAGVVVGAMTSRRKPWLGQLLLVLAFAHLALSAVRNEPLFVIVSVPLLARLFVDNSLFAPLAVCGAYRPGWLAQLRRRLRLTAQRFDVMESRSTMHLIPIAMIVVLASSCLVAGRIPGMHALVSCQFDPKKMPTTTLEYIVRTHLPWNRGFSLDNWGGYIRYKTGERVFIDDRLDFYGQSFYLRYVQTISTVPGWQNLLDEYGVQWVLFPKNTSLVKMLKETPDWQLKTQDQAADLFVRQPRRFVSHDPLERR